MPGGMLTQSAISLQLVKLSIELTTTYGGSQQWTNTALGNNNQKLIKNLLLIITVTQLNKSWPYGLQPN